MVAVDGRLFSVRDVKVTRVTLEMFYDFFGILDAQYHVDQR